MSLVRQTIMDAVATRLKTVNGTGGYTTNFSNVYEWAPTSIESQSIPCIIYREVSCETRNNNSDKNVPIDIHLHRLKVEFEIKLAGLTGPADARQAISDVYKAIGVEAGGATPANWGGVATMTDPDGDDIVTDIQDRQYTSIIIKIIITFRTAAWDSTTAR